MKNLLITGASRGVGRAIAVRAAASGEYDRIIINSIKNEALLEETAQLVHTAAPYIQCITSLGDVGDIHYVESLYSTIGGVSTIINNAALSYVGLLIDMTPDEWELSLRTNLTSIYNTCHTFLPDMIRAGSGQIVNISSIWGRVGASCEVAYSATKGAVNSFTRALAKELAPSNIQVNAASLGIVDTDMNRHLSSEELLTITDDIPIGRIMTTEEAADAVMTLLHMPAYFTGEVVEIDGGWQ